MNMEDAFERYDPFRQEEDAEKKPVEPDLKFRRAPGVASVGPDVEGVPSDDADSAEEVLEPAPNKGSVVVGRETESTSPDKAEPQYAQRREGVREQGRGDDNMKTLPDSRKERNSRKALRDFLDKQSDQAA